MSNAQNNFRIQNVQDFNGMNMEQDYVSMDFDPNELIVVSESSDEFEYSNNEYEMEQLRSNESVTSKKVKYFPTKHAGTTQLTVSEANDVQDEDLSYLKFIALNEANRIPFELNMHSQNMKMVDDRDEDISDPNISVLDEVEQQPLSLNLRSNRPIEKFDSSDDKENVSFDFKDTSDNITLRMGLKLPSGTTITARSNQTSAITPHKEDEPKFPSVTITPKNAQVQANPIEFLPSYFPSLNLYSGNENNNFSNLNSLYQETFTRSLFDGFLSAVNRTSMPMEQNGVFKPNAYNDVTHPTRFGIKSELETAKSMLLTSADGTPIKFENSTPQQQTAIPLKLSTVAIKNNFLCQYCDLAFSVQTECIKHELCHDKNTPFACNFCILSMSSRAALIDHIKNIHMKARAYTCTLCKKGFSRRSDLRKHTVIHTGVRPYTCGLCGKSFSRNTNLTKHLRIHTGCRPHVCPNCPRSFATLGELTIHIKSHNSANPYQCSHCNASFTRQDKLIVHEQMHIELPHMNISQIYLESDFPNSARHVTSEEATESSNVVKNVIQAGEQVIDNSLALNLNEQEKEIYTQEELPKESFMESLPQPFNCEICSKTFTRESALNKHVALHLDGLFTCTKCGITYSRPEKIQLHMIQWHGGENSHEYSNNKNSFSDNVSPEEMLNFVVAHPELSIRELCQYFNIIPNYNYVNESDEINEFLENSFTVTDRN